MRQANILWHILYRLNITKTTIYMSFIKTGGTASQFLQADGSVLADPGYMVDTWSKSSGLSSSYSSITLNSVSLLSVTSYTSLTVYRVNGIAYGCSFTGRLSVNCFNSALASVKSSASVLSSSSYAPKYPVLLMYENAIGNKKNNRSAHVWIGTDGYLYAEGDPNQLITDSPYAQTNLQRPFYGCWLITPTMA